MLRAWITATLRNRRATPSMRPPRQPVSLPIDETVWDADGYAVLGRSTLDLVLNRHMWIHRVVEKVAFVDDRRSQRRVSVDFTLPEWPMFLECQKVLLPGTYIVPVGLLTNENLKRFEIIDEVGRALPILTREQNKLLAASMRINSSLISESLAGPNVRIRGRAVPPDVAQVRAALDGLSSELDQSFFLCAIVRGQPGHRRVIRYAYEDTPEPSQVSAEQREDVVREFMRYVGIRGRPVLLRCPAASYGRSYHVEVGLPEELFFEKGQLVASIHGHDAAVLASQEGVNRLHLHPRDPVSTEVRLLANIRMTPEGLLSSSVMVGLLSFALFAAGVVLEAARAVPTQGNIAASLLLALPAIFGAYLFRPGEHKLVGRSAAGIRATLQLLIVVSFAGAGLLAVRLQDSRFPWWIGLTIAAGVLTVPGAAAWLRSSYIRRATWSTGSPRV